MRWLLLPLALIVVDGLSQEPTPSPSKSGNPPQSRAAETKKYTSKDQRRTEQPPLSVKILDIEKRDAEGKRDAKLEEDKTALDWWLVIFTGIAATATAILAIVTGLLAYFTFGLWTATKNLLKGAQIAEAPYLFPEIIAHSGFQQDPAGPPTIMYAFRNQGKTPAFIKRLRDFTIFDTALPPQPIFPEELASRPEVHTPVGVNQSGGFFLAEAPPGVTAINITSRNGGSLFLIGEVEYEDIFDGIWVQAYCLMITDVSWNENKFISHSYRTGDRAYNYRREQKSNGPLSD